MPHSGEELQEEMPVVDHLVLKVGVLMLQAHDFTPSPKDGIQERPESFHLSDLVEHVCTKRSQSLHFLGDDVHVAESLHSMTISRLRTSTNA